MAAITSVGSIKKYFRGLKDPRVVGRSRHCWSTLSSWPSVASSATVMIGRILNCSPRTRIARPGSSGFCGCPRASRRTIPLNACSWPLILAFSRALGRWFLVLTLAWCLGCTNHTETKLDNGTAAHAKPQAERPQKKKVTGENKGKIMKGIYDWDDGKWVWCFNNDIDGPRPTTFDAEKLGETMEMCIHERSELNE